ncbi:MAG: hypothetical protein NVS2B8_13390 [Vulcanimicrobiaceae bacterium]
MTGIRLAIPRALIVLAFAIPAPAAECVASAGGRVVLASDAVDPDVFLWDSRARLLNYSAGQWGSTKAIFAHTMLAQPGTKAMIVSCVPAVAHLKYGAADEDAIGVRVLSGPHRGRYGWVLSSDIHLKSAAPLPGSFAAAADAKR